MLSEALVCSFGGIRVAAVRFETSSVYFECPIPAGRPNTTVLLQVIPITEPPSQPIRTARPMYFTYVADDSFTQSVWDGEYSTDDSRWCVECVRSGPSDCTADCTGRALGSARIDQCGTCSDGSTGHVAESQRDCLGVCNGSFRLMSVAPESQPSSPLRVEEDGRRFIGGRGVTIGASHAQCMCEPESAGGPGNHSNVEGGPAWWCPHAAFSSTWPSPLRRQWQSTATMPIPRHYWYENIAYQPPVYIRDDDTQWTFIPIDVTVPQVAQTNCNGCWHMDGVE